ncbi:MAG: sigma-70 family RNA polymerase sigma factor [Lentisphaerales bacterium]|nr:sigma-70 family RNA polymerase sigma factor [Lentisphaerales bacterium]
MAEWVTNPTLLQRVKNVYDDSSWDEFNKYYRPYIMMITKGLNMRHNDAEEIVQLIMIKIWKNIPKFNYNPNRGHFRGWIRTITVNSVRNYIDTKAYKQLSLDKMHETGEKTDVDDSFSESAIGKIADQEWENYICTMAWDNVKHHFSESVQNVFTELSKGTDCDVIAEKLDLKRNSVYKYRKRINERLFKEIRKLNRELG